MRMIDADKLKAHYAWWKGGTRELTMDEAKSDFDTIVDLQPTIEPKRGRWITWDGGICCSLCRAEYESETMNYCPNCGAKMDEVEG